MITLPTQQPPWLTNILTNDNFSVFPYHYLSTHSKQIRFSPSIYPDQQDRQQKLDYTIVDLKKMEPLYVLNIPFFASESLSMDENAKLINNLVTNILNQSFYNPDKIDESKTIAPSRVVLFLGVNRPYSIDADKNEEFTQWIKNFKTIKGIRTFIIGTFWHPKMAFSNSSTVIKKAETEAALEQNALEAFKLLKTKNSKKAEDVKTFLCNQKFTSKNKEKVGRKSRINAQIPYQQIRDWIINETFSQEWLKNLFLKELPPFVYLGCMDGDTHSLHGTEADDIGLLKYYDTKIINKKFPPLLMSAGYFLPPDADKVSHLANLIDMNQREKIAQFFPTGVYFPEPNLFLLLNEFWEKYKGKISFVGGVGNDTESRRLIENLIGILDVSRVEFIAQRCLVTTPPERMKAKKILAKPYLGNNELGCFDTGFHVKDLSKEFFNSLASTSQTHLKPKIWAANIHIGLKSYNAIPEKITEIAKIHGPLMNICKVFDFPSFFHEMGFEFLLKSNIKINVRSYKSYVGILCGQRIEILRNQIFRIESIPGVPDNYVYAQIDKLTSNFQKLAKLKISEEYQFQILYAAALSGEAVYNTLASMVRGFD